MAAKKSFVGRGPVNTLTRSHITNSVEIVSAPQTLTHRDGNDSETAEIVLFLLDLARTTRNASFLEIATVAVSQLTDGLSRTMRYSVNPDPGLIHTLSRTAFTFAEAWKITHDVRYREAGLSVIRYLSEISSAPETTVHE